MTVWAGDGGTLAAWPPGGPPGAGLTVPGSLAAGADGVDGGILGALTGAGEPHAARASTPAAVARTRSLMAANRSPDAPRWPCGAAGEPLPGSTELWLNR